MPKYDIQTARSEGYSDQEIANHLQKKYGYKISDAISEGYSLDEVVSHLENKESKQNKNIPVVPGSAVLPQKSIDTANQRIELLRADQGAQEEDQRFDFSKGAGVLLDKAYQSIATPAYNGETIPAEQLAAQPFQSLAKKALGSGIVGEVAQGIGKAADLIVGPPISSGYGAIKATEDAIRNWKSGNYGTAALQGGVAGMDATFSAMMASPAGVPLNIAIGLLNEAPGIRDMVASGVSPSSTIIEKLIANNQIPKDKIEAARAGARILDLAPQMVLFHKTGQEAGRVWEEQKLKADPTIQTDIREMTKKESGEDIANDWQHQMAEEFRAKDAKYAEDQKIYDERASEPKGDYTPAPTIINVDGAVADNAIPIIETKPQEGIVTSSASNVRERIKQTPSNPAEQKYLSDRAEIIAEIRKNNARLSDVEIEPMADQLMRDRYDAAAKEKMNQPVSGVEKREYQQPPTLIEGVQDNPRNGIIVLQSNVREAINYSEKTPEQIKYEQDVASREIAIQDLMKKNPGITRADAEKFTEPTKQPINVEFEDGKKPAQQHEAEGINDKIGKGEEAKENILPGGETNVQAGQNKYRQTIKSFIDSINSILSNNKPTDRESIFSSLDNTPTPIGEISEQYAKRIGIKDNKVYSGMAYFVDHHLNNHPKTEHDRYFTIPEVLSNPTEVKIDNRGGGKNKFAFIRQYDKYHSVVIEAGVEDGKLVLYKTFFSQTKKPYENLPSVELSAPEMGDTSIISPASSNEAPAEAISALPSANSNIPSAEANVNRENGTKTPDPLTPAKLAEASQAGKEIGIPPKQQKSLLIEALEKAKKHSNIIDRLNSISSKYREASRHSKKSAKLKKEYNDFVSESVKLLKQDGIDAEAVEDISREGGMGKDFLTVRIITHIPGDGTFYTPLKNIDQYIDIIRKKFPTTKISTETSAISKGSNPAMKSHTGDYSKIEGTDFYVVDGYIVMRGDIPKGKEINEFRQGQVNANGSGKKLIEDAKKTKRQEAEIKGFTFRDADYGSEAVSVNPVSGTNERAVVQAADGSYYLFDQKIFLTAKKAFPDDNAFIDDLGRLILMDGKKIDAIVMGVRNPDTQSPRYTRAELEKSYGNLSFILGDNSAGKAQPGDISGSALSLGGNVVANAVIQNSDLSDEDKKKYSALVNMATFAGLGAVIAKGSSGKSIQSIVAQAKKEWLSKSTRSSFFKEWFGDWENNPLASSKVVDNAGRPIKVFSGHSNSALYKNYNPKKGTAGVFYASEDPSIASNYAFSKLGAKEYYENGSQYRIAGKNGEYSKKIWQIKLTDEQKKKIEEIKSTKNEYDDDKSPLAGMSSYIENNYKYDKDAARWRYSGGDKNLQNIWEFYEQMGYNIAYPKSGETPIYERQVKNEFEILLDDLNIDWQSHDWSQPGVFPVYLNIRNPIDVDAPFPNDLLRALKDRAKGERERTNEEKNYSHWTKDYPLKEWIRDIESGSEFWSTQIPKKALPIIKEFGYDGIKERGAKGSDAQRGNRSINWIAFEPEQIKSASSNRGTFDKTNSDMLMSISGPAAMAINEIATDDEDTKKKLRILFASMTMVGIGAAMSPNVRNAIRDIRSAAAAKALRGEIKSNEIENEVRRQTNEFIQSSEAKEFKSNELRQIQEASGSTEFKKEVRNISSEIEKIPFGGQSNQISNKESVSIAQPSTNSNISVKMDKSGEMVSSSSIISQAEKDFNVPIRVGKQNFRGKYSGYYYPKQEVVRLREANDLATMSHEVAHHIDHTMPSLDKKSYKNELGLLDYDQKKQRVDEGFAEFMRHYITDDDAKSLAPAFYDYFTNTFLKDNPSIANKIDALKQSTTRWREQGAEQRVLSQIDFDGEKPSVSIKEAFESAKLFLQKQFTDQLQPINYAFKKMMDEAGVESVRPSEDPYQIAMQGAKAASSKARSWVMDGVYNYGLQKISKGLKEIVAPISGDEKRAISYAYAKRALLLHDRGINPGISRADAKYVIEKNNSPELERFSQELTKWNDAVMDYLVDAGGLSADVASKIRMSNAIYIPLKRVFIDQPISGGRGKGFTDLPSVIKKIKGSGREIINPLESMIAQAEQFIAVADKARVARAIVDFAENNNGLGRFVEKVQAPPELRKVELENIKKQIEDAGGDLDMADLTATINIFSQGKSYYGKDNIVSVLRNGKREFYQLHPDLYDAMKGMDRITLSWLGAILSSPAKIARLGYTGLNAGFSLLTNPLRDIQTFWLQSEFAGGRPDKAARAIAAEIRGKDNYVKQYRASGAEMAQPLGLDRNVIQRTIEDIMANDLESKSINIAKHPIDVLRTLFSFPEAGVRMAEFKAAMQSFEPKIAEAMERGALDEVKKLREDAAIVASNASSEVTVNFRRAGEMGQFLNQFIPFFNPSIQGISRMGRTAMDHPLRSGIRATAALTAPTLGLWWLNKDEDWYKNLPTWQKYAFWNFKIGDNIIRLPKPFEWGYVFAGIPEAIADDLYRKNPGDETWIAIKESFKVMTPPMVPAFGGPAGEVYFNWDMFRERPLVSKSQEGLLPEMQYTPSSSGVAKELGKILNVSPIMIDHLLNGYTGGLAQEITRGLPSEFKENADIPVVGRLFTRSSTVGFNGKMVNDFYKAYDNAQKVNRSINAIRTGKRSSIDLSEDEEINYNAYKDYRKVAEQLKILRGYQQQIINMNVDAGVKRKLIEANEHAAAIIAENALNSSRRRSGGDKSGNKMVQNVH